VRCGGNVIRERNKKVREGDRGCRDMAKG